MSGKGTLVKGPHGLPEASAEAVRADLEAARNRVRDRLAVLEQDLGRAGRWRKVVRKHPVLSLGAALAVGYLVGRVLRR